jgi:Fe-S cluster biogenesis protein NfuA
MPAEFLDDQIRRVIDHDVSPHVRGHLGDISFDRLDDEGVVHVTFSGACEACSYRRHTLLGAVLPRLAAIEGVTGVAAEGVPLPKSAQRRVVGILSGKPWDPDRGAGGGHITTGIPAP